MDMDKFRLGVVFGELCIATIGVIAALGGYMVEAIACAAIIGTTMDKLAGRNGVS